MQWHIEKLQATHPGRGRNKAEWTCPHLPNTLLMLPICSSHHLLDLVMMSWDVSWLISEDSRDSDSNGADEFLKFVEFRRIPWQHIFLNPLITLQGNFSGIKHCAIASFTTLVYNLSALQSVEAILSFFPQDFKEATKSSSLGFMLPLSGSTDILGVIVKCMQEVRHHFKLASEDVSRELGITNALRIKDATRQMEKLMTWESSLSHIEHF